jgi:hypothetical protein
LAGGASEGLLDMHHKAIVAATAQMASKHLTFIFMGSVLNSATAFHLPHRRHSRFPGKTDRPCVLYLPSREQGGNTASNLPTWGDADGQGFLN